MGLAQARRVIQYLQVSTGATFQELAEATDMVVMALFSARSERDRLEQALPRLLRSSCSVQSGMCDPAEKDSTGLTASHKVKAEQTIHTAI